MDKRVANNLTDIIKLLQSIADAYPDMDIPVSVNLYGDRVLALQSICLDNNDEGIGIQVLFEADRDSYLEQTEEFQFYTQGRGV